MIEKQVKWCNMSNRKIVIKFHKRFSSISVYECIMYDGYKKEFTNK